MGASSHGGFWHALAHIVEDIVVSIYQPLPFVLLISVLAMFFVMYADEHGWSPRDYPAHAVRAWRGAFDGSALFRSTFFLVFFVVLVLFKTLFLRPTWLDPLSDVFGGWGLTDGEGQFTSEAIENVILFVPFSLLLSDVLHRSGQTGEGRPRLGVPLRAARASALFSVGIECLQVLLRLGTFQVSDLVYNTAGGLVGAALYQLVLRDRVAR